MGRLQETEKPRTLITLAQKAKREVIEEGKTVTLSKEVAALGFGVSVSSLDRLRRTRKILVIEPREEWVEVSLQPEIGTWRDLWQEVLESLERGRSSVSKARGEYEEKYRELQRLVPGISEEEATLRQLNLCGLWTMFPVATKRELSEINPGNVLRTMGIQDGIF